MTFEGCRKPYPLHVLNYNLGEEQFKLTADTVLRYAVTEIQKEKATLLRFLADAPERHLGLGLGAVTGRFG